MVLNTLYTVVIILLARTVDGDGLHQERGPLLTDKLLQESSTAKLLLMMFIFFLLITALVMVTSEICAHTMRPPVTTIAQQSCSPNFIVNPIPFFSLDICVVLVFVKLIFVRFLFETTVPPWLLFCGLLIAILATNAKARKHLALRLRQKVAIMTVGRHNTVHPIISVALVEM